MSMVLIFRSIRSNVVAIFVSVTPEEISPYKEVFLLSL